MADSLDAGVARMSGQFLSLPRAHLIAPLRLGHNTRIADLPPR